MVESKFVRTTVGILAIGLVAGGCGGRGDTDGGPANGDTGPGYQYVDDGGSGSTLVIEHDGEIRTGEQEDFRVIATDPNGQPLSFIRIFCETEQGISIIEPSRGGVAYEHTNINGIMSGVIGGLHPGSYLMECRAPQGFNLIARKSLRIVGDIPDDFSGFDGAAGGNLGGGLLVEGPDDEELDQIEEAVTETETN